ncbi:pentapeptide repeat-containing protein [Varunaivibrio sulfuroxidans]|uniref:Pentapeptide repeat protein n=1 Tax=Varunaivibrio sulfuroxidans TaxID=1773489 RepID=A0A4R3JFW1_9PROT|nr:pentapeptide repeat-containing protein [Varunaivibrio sulfuroxidans]TCS64762.1 pentapeptide repeat protein [Varunaivibrio sulfuroxidans]WES29933.1 pentapeptide repeat-containing protein [Varunaivibrio sulfuroxidans]
MRMFSEKLLKLVEIARSRGEAINFSGVVVPADLDLDAFACPENPLPGVDFAGASFEGDLDLTEVYFDGPARFTGAHFAGDLDLIVARFLAVDFDDALIAGCFDASETRFRGPVSFRNTRFEGPAIFRETQFYHPVDFSGATFKIPPAFDDVVFPEGSRLPLGCDPV